MNSTNKKEKELITKIASEIRFTKEDFWERLGKEDHCESYFIEGKKLLTFKLADIMEYAPESPEDIKELLDNLWKERKTDDMKRFIQVCMVAAMKNRKTERKPKDVTVSHSVYEF